LKAQLQVTVDDSGHMLAIKTVKAVQF